MPESDAELVARAQSGQKPAYAELVHRHVRWVGAVAAGVLGDLGAARDVVCESFRRAFVSLSKLPDRRRFQPWLYTITQRTALDWLRSQQESQPTSAIASVQATEPEPRQHALAEVLALPPHYRESLLLRAIGGCTCAEVARVTGGEPADAEARLARAEQALARRLAATRSVAR